MTLLTVDQKRLKFLIECLIWITCKSFLFATIPTWYIVLLMFVELVILLILWCMNILMKLKSLQVKSLKNGYIVRRSWHQKMPLLLWLQNNLVLRQLKITNKRLLCLSFQRKISFFDNLLQKEFFITNLLSNCHKIVNQYQHISLILEKVLARYIQKCLEETCKKSLFGNES